jgi:type III secretion protein C
MDNQTRFFVRVASYTSADLYSVQTGVSLRVLPLLVDGPGRPQVKLGVHVTDGQLTGQQVDNIPVITSTSIDTEAFLNEGDALLIAGYRVKSATHLQDGVPGLSRIPLLGALFRYRDDEESKMERLFLITPRIIDLDAQEASDGGAPPAAPRVPADRAPAGAMRPLPPLPPDGARTRRSTQG